MVRHVGNHCFGALPLGHILMGDDEAAVGHRRAYYGKFSPVRRFYDAACTASLGSRGDDFAPNFFGVLVRMSDLNTVTHQLNERAAGRDDFARLPRNSSGKY